MRQDDSLTLDKKLLETLCSYQATWEEICSLLKINKVNLEVLIQKEYNLNLENFYKEYSAAGKVKLRENMFQLSKKSPEMAKHLSEKHLDLPKKEDKVEVIYKYRELVIKQVLRKLQKDEDYINLKTSYQMFIVNYILTKNGSESAIKAGYAVKSARAKASNLLTINNIGDIIQKYTNLEADLASDEKEELINDLKTIKNQTMELVLLQPAFATSAISAIKQISSMRGFDAPKEITGKNGNPIEITAIPAEKKQLEKLLLANPKLLEELEKTFLELNGEGV